jgi:Ca-activated chloride channel family protein
MTPAHVTIITEEDLLRDFPPDDQASLGTLATPRGALPLEALDVRGHIVGLLAEVELTQTFVNCLDEPLEATYIFPLPDRHAVTRFRMEVGQRVIEGVLKERGAARREYDQAVRQGHRASIAEEERPGVFTLRVGNLMPGERATVRLGLSGPLHFDSGEATFRFPLVVAPRYIPGHPLPGRSVGDGVVPDTDAVPDASRITPPVLLPGFPNPVRLSLAVDVAPSPLRPREFRSSLHAVLSEHDLEGTRITLQPGERLNRDFILRFRVGDDMVKSDLALLPDVKGGREGTFLLTLVPPANLSKVMRPRDVVFVLDRSGSMGGWKMVAARRALGRMVDTLTQRDRFTLYAFDDSVETPPEIHGTGLAGATDRNRFRAVEWLARIEARGGTEMAQPLDLAVRALTEASGGRQSPGAAAPRDRILVLITDGQVGNEDQILHLLGKRLAGLRIFTLGIDQAVNEAFLKRLATLGGGFCEVVESEDRLDEVMKRLHSRIATPVLSGLNVEASGLRLQAETVVPGRLPDLFTGAALTVLGRYQGAHEGSLVLSGRDMAGRGWTEKVAGRACGNPAVVHAWARAYLRELEDRFVVGVGNRADLERVITEVSLRYGVLCRFTAFVAVDRSEVVNEGGKQHQIVQPVEAPAGWKMLHSRASAKPSRFILGTAGIASGEMSYDTCGGPAPSTNVEGDIKYNWRDLYHLGEIAHVEPGLEGPELSAGGHKPGLMRRAFNALFGRKGCKGEPAAPATEALDLTAYRRRAQQMLDDMHAAVKALGGREQALVALLGQLTALIEDLKSVGASAEALGPLEELQKELQVLQAEIYRSEDVLELLLVRAEEVLKAFAGEAVPATDRGQTFWK